MRNLLFFSLLWIDLPCQISDGEGQGLTRDGTNFVSLFVSLTASESA